MAPFLAPRLTPAISNGPRTPASVSKHKERHRLATQSPSLPSSTPISEHPIEVIGRIRDHTEGSESGCMLQVHNNGQTVRLKTDQGYRNFGLDGVSLAEKEDLQNFYRKYVESRIEIVKKGGRCTIMMYGPTGAGKSYTMFGSAKEPGIAYRALEKLLGGFNEQTGHDASFKKIFVNVTILEIYNEEAFDLLATCSNINPGHWIKPSRVRVEIMGKKAKNAISISGSDAEKISKEIAKVEKRRVVKSTLCNDRSSRSHCLVTVDVPPLGGRLVLVDMAGSENLEQAGLGLESKLQSGKINQGNIALKRVVEAIANGDSYIPFRDSKLTMLLQDSFEDDESKILMILCMNTEPKDMHKTIGTLEYGSKAKCIVRLPVSPEKKKTNLDRMDFSALEAKIQNMELYISQLEAENLMKEKEREEMTEKLMHRDQDLVVLRKVIEQVEEEHREKCDLIHDDVSKAEMERKLQECQRIADDLIEAGKMSLEGMVIEQRREIDSMRCRMEEIEREVQLLLKVNLQPHFAKDSLVFQDDNKSESSSDISEKTKKDACMGDMSAIQPPALQPLQAMPVRDLSKEAIFKEEPAKVFSPMGQELCKLYVLPPCDVTDNVDAQVCGVYMEESSDSHQQEMYDRTRWLPVIPEESEGEEGFEKNEASHERLSFADDGLEMQSKEPILESSQEAINGNLSSLQSVHTGLVHVHEMKCGPTSSIASRRSRIENIFALCGNQRELISTQTTGSMKEFTEEQRHQSKNELKQAGVHLPSTTEEPLKLETTSPPQNLRASPITSKDALSPSWNKSSEMSPVQVTPLKPRQLSTENTPPHGRSSLLTPLGSKLQSSKSPRKLSFDRPSLSPKALIGTQQHADDDDLCEVFVKWETSKESCGGKLIKIVSMKESAPLALLRQEVESILALEEKHDFQFLMLGDPSGAPVKRDNEVHLTVGSLPDCYRKQGSKLACLRRHFRHGMLSPLRPVENQISHISSILSSVRPTDGNSNHLKSPKGTLLSCQIMEGTPTLHSANGAIAKHRLSFLASPHAKGLRL